MLEKGTGLPCGLAILPSGDEKTVWRYGDMFDSSLSWKRIWTAPAHSCVQVRTTSTYFAVERGCMRAYIISFNFFSGFEGLLSTSNTTKGAAPANIILLVS